MKIHTIGDSHAVYGWSGVEHHHLGAVLCYSYGKDHNRVPIQTYNIQTGDVVIFCLGEIDCRCHIHKKMNESTSYQMVIDSIVERYFASIHSSLSEIADVKLKHIGVYNVVPPVKKEGLWENPEFPYLGTDEERRNYVQYFNAKLSAACALHGYIFVDVYEKYADSDGFLRKDLSDGNVHILDGCHISDFLRIWA